MKDSRSAPVLTPAFFLAGTVLAEMVSLTAPHAALDELGAIVAGCRQVLTEDECVTSSNGGAPWRASIVWVDEARTIARIELVHVEGGAEEVRLSRDVEFGPQDPLLERHHAVGVIVAAHVVAASSRPASPPAPAETRAAPTPTTPPNEEKPSQKASPRLGLDGAFLVGGGFAEGPLPVGAQIRPWWRPTPLPLTLLVAARWARSGGPVRADWTTLSAGVAARIVPLDPFLTLELRTEFVSEFVYLQAESEDQVDSASTWRFGGRLGADAFFRFAPHAFVFVGGDLGFLTPDVIVDSAGERAGRTSGPELQGLLGVRFAAD